MALVRTHRSTDLPGANRRVAGVSRRSPKGRGHGWPPGIDLSGTDQDRFSGPEGPGPWMAPAIPPMDKFPSRLCAGRSPVFVSRRGLVRTHRSTDLSGTNQDRASGPRRASSRDGARTSHPRTLFPEPRPLFGNFSTARQSNLENKQNALKFPDTGVGQGGMIPLAPSSAGCYDSEVILNCMVEFP